MEYQPQNGQHNPNLLHLYNINPEIFVFDKSLTYDLHEMSTLIFSENYIIIIVKMSFDFVVISTLCIKTTRYNTCSLEIPDHFMKLSQMLALKFS